MKSEGVKAALARYQANAYTSEPIVRLQKQIDMAALADAYAAEHPADEDEPITPEWCLAMGAMKQTPHRYTWFDKKHGDPRLIVRKYLGQDSSEPWIVVWPSWPDDIYVRAQVYQLMRALEIPTQSREAVG
jgi:hypothetical protein